MGAIPRSDLAGYRHLHDRVTVALDRCQEEQDVDFKESASWESLKWRITHSALGMGNLRDGGLLIVGVSERGTMWNLTGISEEHLTSFDPDIVASHVNAYVSPHVDVELVVVRHSDGLEYLAIHIREFRDTPLVCKKNGPDRSHITEGRVYIRLPSPARTSTITNALQMHQLLDLAAEKRARSLLEGVRRLGLSVSPPHQNRFDEELGGL